MTCGRSDLLILDTTALINFRGTEELRMVSRSTSLVLATTTVVFHDELLREETRALAQEAIDDEVLEVVDLEGETELDLWQHLRPRFGTGEASALAYAHIHGTCLMTDDQQCFEEAVALLGAGRCVRSGRVLAEALAAGLVTRTEAENIFARWLEETFRMPWETFEQLWDGVFPGEDYPS
jgi:predicted nucleic acid-binding protein